MQLQIFQADAFTCRHFQGNPAAVVPIEKWLPDNVMQQIAMGGNSISRFFAPAAGVDEEDPVTGSAHTLLIPYWSKVTGKDELTAKQASKRGGQIYCKNDRDRVKIGGNAVTCLVGNI